MMIYNVRNDETGYYAEFYSLSEAKKAMKANNAVGFKTKVYANGDWIPCGEIHLKKSNKVFIANTNMTKANY